MTYKTIAVFVGQDCPEAEIEAAINMALQQAAHLSISVVDIAPSISGYVHGSVYAGVSYAAEWHQEVSRRAEALEAKADDIEKQLQRLNATGVVTSALAEAANFEDVIQRRASLSDIVILSRKAIGNEELHDRILNATLFRSPVGVMTAPGMDQINLNPEQVLVASDSNPPAINAVHRSLPILMEAKETHIATFDPVVTSSEGEQEPCADLAEWLTRHGCVVNLMQMPTGGQEVATCILKTARETGVGLVVMGAYGHSKLRQQLFGGTTAAMLTQKELPVIFAH